MIVEDRPDGQRQLREKSRLGRMPRTLSELECAGESVADVLRQLRLERAAAELMGGSRMSIPDIAHGCGCA